MKLKDLMNTQTIGGLLERGVKQETLDRILKGKSVKDCTLFDIYIYLTEMNIVNPLEINFNELCKQ